MRRKNMPIHDSGGQFARVMVSPTMRHTAIPEPPGSEPGDLPVPESHLVLAEERLAQYRLDPARAHSAYDVLGRLARTQR